MTAGVFIKNSRILPDVSPTTVVTVLGAMDKSGNIKRIGISRAIRYIKV